MRNLNPYGLTLLGWAAAISAYITCMMDEGNLSG